jgi:hypothetical protein
MTTKSYLPIQTRAANWPERGSRQLTKRVMTPCRWPDDATVGLSSRSPTLLFAPFFPSKTPVLGRGQDQDATNFLAKIESEVLLIAGQQVRGSSIDRRKEYRDIFVWKTYLPRQGEMHGLNKTDRPKQTGQPAALRGRLEIPTGLVDGVTRRQQFRIVEFPEAL